MTNVITQVALDAHKKEHKVAMLLPGRDEPEEWTVANERREIRRMVRRVKKRSGGPVRFCYEAGVCGFALQRQIEAEGVACMVVAPSLVPVKPGDRVKTDRRDARKLARLSRAGMLTEVHPPTEPEESVRDLCRCREGAQRDLTRIRHQLSKFLLRRGLIYSEGKQWTQKHVRWVGALEFEHPQAQRVFTDYVQELDRRSERLRTLEQALTEVAAEPAYKDRVGWLCCLKGVKTITAMTVLSELHGFERFTSARGLMSYLGLVPSESSSGESRRQGGITKAGNCRVRRVLIEAGWHQGRSAVTSKALRRRRAGQPAWAVAIAERAQRRLYRRYWGLTRKGKSPQKAVTAVARELAGFIWCILCVPHAAESEEASAAPAAPEKVSSERRSTH